MNIREHTRIPPLEAEAHRFSVGQTVRLKGRLGTIPKAGDVFRITATLPARDNILQYRVRNDGESYERVATEDNLELIKAEAAPAGVRPSASQAAERPAAVKSAAPRAKSRK